MANDPVRRDEYTYFRDETNRRLEDLDDRFEAHLKDERDGRRWTWQQILTATGAAVALIGLFLENRGK